MSAPSTETAKVVYDDAYRVAASQGGADFAHKCAIAAVREFEVARDCLKRPTATVERSTEGA